MTGLTASLGPSGAAGGEPGFACQANELSPWQDDAGTLIMFAVTAVGGDRKARATAVALEAAL